jgi:hypothetical protein
MKMSKRIFRKDADTLSAASVSLSQPLGYFGCNSIAISK